MQTQRVAAFVNGLAAMVLLASAPSTAAAQEHCSDLLGQGVRDLLVTSGRASSREAAQQMLCSRSSSEIESDEQGGGGFQGFGITASGGASVSHSTRLHQAMCGYSDMSIEAAQESSTYMLATSRPLLEAYIACRQLDARGIRMRMLVAPDQRSVTFDVHYNATGTGWLTGVSVPDQLRCSGALWRARAQRREITSAVTSMHCTRRVASTGGYAVADAVPISFSFDTGSISYFLPPLGPPPPTPPAPVCEVAVRTVDWDMRSAMTHEFGGVSRCVFVSSGGEWSPWRSAAEAGVSDDRQAWRPCPSAAIVGGYRLESAFDSTYEDNRGRCTFVVQCCAAQ